MKINCSKVVVIIALFFLTLHPSISSAINCTNPPVGWGGKWALDYKKWCEECGGTYYRDGPRCVPGPNWGGRREKPPGAGISTGDPLYQLGFQLGEAIGRSLFGDPEENARRQAELEEAQRQAVIEQERIAAEQARIAEERYRRIMAQLKGLDSSGSLSLNSLKGVSSTEPLPHKSGTAFFGIPSNPSAGFPDPEPKLQLKGIVESGVTVSSSPTEQLNSATVLSRLAAKAGNDEDAKFLANAAFEVVKGGAVDFPPLPEVKGVPVNPVNLDKFTNIRKEFVVARENFEKANREFAEMEYKKRVGQELRKEAEKKLEEAKTQKDKSQSAPSDKKNETDDKLAEAQRLLDEATRLDEKMTEELQKAKDGYAKAESDYIRVEQKTRDYVKGLGGNDNADAGTPKN